MKIQKTIAFKERGGCSGGGKGYLGSNELAFTLSTKQDQSIMQIIYDTTQITSKANGSNPQPEAPCHTLAKGSDAPLLVLDDHGGGIINIYTNEVTGTLRAQIHGHQQIILYIAE